MITNSSSGRGENDDTVPGGCRLPDAMTLKYWVIVYLYLTTAAPRLRKVMQCQAQDAVLAYEEVGAELDRLFQEDALRDSE